jgi:tetratricopeptide (TPR) repeat protein
MKRFFEYCEDNWQDMEYDKTRVDTALGMFAEAKHCVEADSVYARRLALIDEFLEALRSKAQLLGQKRGPVTQLRTVWGPKDPIVIDGRLNDDYWVNCPTSSTGRLRELQTGRQPIFGTTVMAAWDRGHLYFGIRCDEHAGPAVGQPSGKDKKPELNIATTKNEDQSIWYGDLIEIELDTDSHSYYQIAVNPSGALIDLDRGADKSAWYRWQSQAEVATHVAEDHWTVEIRIPVTEDDNDPLNQVIGRKPSSSLPWHFNICRQRIRENGSEYSAFSPTGTAGFHVPMKFGYLHDGRSHRFEADPSVTDYLIASRAASDLMRGRQYDEALTAFLGLAEGEKVTEFQRSDALQDAAACARNLKDFAQANSLVEQVPIESVAKTIRMENLLAERQWSNSIDEFGAEDISAWPFWQIGAGAFARGRAFHAAGDGDRAEEDLQMALTYTSDSRKRMSILRTIGFNRENVLKDDDAALETYQLIAGSSRNTGSAEYFYSIQGAARILTRQGNFDHAIAILERVDPGKLSGSWSGSMWLARGQTLQAAGRQVEALKAYHAVLENEAALPSHKQAAQEAVQQLRTE